METVPSGRCFAILCPGHLYLLNSEVFAIEFGVAVRISQILVVVMIKDVDVFGDRFPSGTIM
jgi:hypothetical protein